MDVAARSRSSGSSARGSRSRACEIQPEFSFARVLAGFSALLDADGRLAARARHAVQGVYPVRVAYPVLDLVGRARAPRARVVRRQRRPVAAGLRRARNHDRAARHGRRSTAPLAARQRLARASTSWIRAATRRRRRRPEGPSRRRAARHGARRHPRRRPRPARESRRRARSERAADPRRRLAAGRPRRLRVYARTDQLIEGLERAVDPNADGDAHDAARVALVGVAAPYAGFADDPAARASPAPFA